MHDEGCSLTVILRHRLLTLRTIPRSQSQRCIRSIGRNHKCRLPSSDMLGPDATQGPGLVRSRGGAHSLSVWSQTYDWWRSRKPRLLGVDVVDVGRGDGLSQREIMTAPSGQANVVLLREVGPITFLGPESIEITPKTYENPFQLPNLPNLLNLLATSSFFSRFSSVCCTRPSQVPHSWSMHSRLFITQVLISLVRWSCSQQGKVKKINELGIHIVLHTHAGADPEGLPLVYCILRCSILTNYFLWSMLYIVYGVRSNP